MRYTTFTDDEVQLLFDECLRALADGSKPLSELTDHLLSLGGFGFLRTRLAERGRRVTLNSVGNPLSYDDRFSSGPVFVNAHADDDKLLGRVDVVLTGRVFTTQLSVADAATGSLCLDTDLIAYDELLFDVSEFTVNGELGGRTVDSETGRCELRGGPGWLDDFPLGSMLTVMWADGGLQVARYDGMLGSGTNEAKTLVAHANKARAGHGFNVYEPLIEQLTIDSTAYRSAVPPVSQLLLDSGFEQRNGWFGRAGTDWHEPDVAEELDLRSYMIEKHSFGSCCIDAYDKVLELWHDHVLAKAESREPDVDYGLAGQLLAHAAVADGFDDCLIHRLGSSADMAALSTEFLLAVVSDCGPATSAAQYLIGKAVERNGHFDEAAHLYEMALASDQTYTPPYAPLAWLAFDRSEFGRARELLARSGLEPRSPDFGFFPRRLGGRSEPARNACCPCGSGRKYKTCHAGKALLSPWDRLQLKYDRHVVAMKSYTRVTMTTFIACDFDADRADRFRGDRFLTDVNRFEGNGFADFVDIRGSLFPSDEGQIVARLGDTKRSLFEVTRVDDQLWIQDVGNNGAPTPGASTVVGPNQLPDLRVGDRILARLLPTSATTATLIGETLHIPSHAEPSLRAVLNGEPTPSSADGPDADRGHELNERDLNERLAIWYVTEYATASAGRKLNRQ